MGGAQIGKVASQTGLSIDAIRFYEREGLLSKPMRSEGRFPLYREQDIQQLRFVRQAQELGCLHARARPDRAKADGRA